MNDEEINIQLVEMMMDLELASSPGQSEGKGTDNMTCIVVQFIQ